MVPFVGVFAFVLILTNVHARHTHSSSHFLRHLLSQRFTDYTSPIIVIVDTRSQALGQTDDSPSESDERADEADDEEAYQLYNQLRSRPEDDLSSEEAARLQETKQALRISLIPRCTRMKSCERSCPKPKKFTCVMVCQQKFDKENACDEPVEQPKCGVEYNCEKKQKWGRTMPPSWLMFK